MCRSCMWFGWNTAPSRIQSHTSASRQCRRHKTATGHSSQEYKASLRCWTTARLHQGGSGTHKHCSQCPCWRWQAHSRSARRTRPGPRVGSGPRSPSGRRCHSRPASSPPAPSGPGCCCTSTAGRRGSGTGPRGRSTCRSAHLGRCWAHWPRSRWSNWSDMLQCLAQPGTRPAPSRCRG